MPKFLPDNSPDTPPVCSGRFDFGAGRLWIPTRNAYIPTTSGEVFYNSASGEFYMSAVDGDGDVLRWHAFALTEMPKISDDFEDDVIGPQWTAVVGQGTGNTEQNGRMEIAIGPASGSQGLVTSGLALHRDYPIEIDVYCSGSAEWAAATDAAIIMIGLAPSSLALDTSSFGYFTYGGGDLAGSSGSVTIYHQVPGPDSQGFTIGGAATYPVPVPIVVGQLQSSGGINYRIQYDPATANVLFYMKPADQAAYDFTGSGSFTFGDHPELHVGVFSNAEGFTSYLFDVTLNSGVLIEP